MAQGRVDHGHRRALAAGSSWTDNVQMTGGGSNIQSAMKRQLMRGFFLLAILVIVAAFSWLIQHEGSIRSAAFWLTGTFKAPSPPSARGLPGTLGYDIHLAQSRGVIWFRADTPLPARRGGSGWIETDADGTAYLKMSFYRKVGSSNEFLVDIRAPFPASHSGAATTTCEISTNREFTVTVAVPALGMTNQYGPVILPMPD